jgi:hypothetical protein
LLSGWLRLSHPEILFPPASLPRIVFGVVVLLS